MLLMLCMLQFVRRQSKGMEVFMCEAGDAEMKLQLRALDESLAESSRLNKLMELAAIEPGAEQLCSRHLLHFGCLLSHTCSSLQRCRGQQNKCTSIAASCAG